MPNITLKDISDLLVEKTKQAANCIGMTAGTGCSTAEYEDIIYVTTQKQFWLLPKNLANQLKQSAAKLANDVATPDKVARMQNLETSGLIHCIATPKLESFLIPEEQQQYLDAKWLLSDAQLIHFEIQMIYIGILAAHRFGHGFLYTAKETDHPKTKQYLKNISDELVSTHYDKMDYIPEVDKRDRRFYYQCEPERTLFKKLDQKARAQAQAAGYEIRDEKIYTPEQIRIKKLIDSYVKNQKIIQQNENTSTDKNINVFQAVANYKARIKELEELQKSPMIAIGYTSIGVLINSNQTKQDLNTLEQTILAQTECIIELANFGIAVPEFALGDQDPQEGMKRLHELRSLQAGREEIAQALKDRFEIWYKASGSHVVPPLPIFDPYVIKIAEYDNKIADIQNKAEQIANSFKPPKLLFWNPNEFKPKETEWLVKGNMPLREFSIASGDKNFLSHISLYDVVAKNTALFDMLNNASQHIKSLNKDDEHFDAYLKENMAYCIKFKDDWYDKEKSTFKSKEFFEYIDTLGWKVKSIETEEQRIKWTNTLNAIIFEENVQRHIMAFDTSLSGAFIRLLGGPNMAQMSFEASGPKMENLKLGSIEFKLKVSPLHGQVDIFDFNFPNPNAAFDISLPYYTYRGEKKSLDFGRFYMNIRAKAWGFAGVSLMAGAHVALSDDLGKLGIKVTDEATGKTKGRTGTGAMAEFELFAGVQAGIKMAITLMWQPPANLTTFNTVYQQIMAPQSQQLIPTFRVLSKLEGSAAGQIGASLSGGFGIILKDGKLHVAFDLSVTWGVGGKVKVDFEVDYRSVGDLVQIVCKALIDNDMEPLQWVANDALDELLKIAVLGVAFPTVAYWSFWTVTKLDAFYQSIVCSGNGGIIGYYMMLPEYRQHFEDWFMILPAQSVGPLLWTLTTTPKAFKVDETGEEFTKDYAIVYQQQAINLCLGWIKKRATTPFSKTVPNEAQKLFEASVCRMNVQGIIDINENVRNTSYCDNRYAKLELAMEWAPRATPRLMPIHDQLKQDFLKHVKDLGCHMDDHCAEVLYKHPGLPWYIYQENINK